MHRPPLLAISLAAGALLAGTLAVHAAEAQLSVFGFALGLPLNLPQCPYNAVARTVCAEEPRRIKGYGIPVRRVQFPPKNSPAIVKDRNFLALESHGLLIGIQFLTAGVSTQQATLKQLREKYGPPSSQAHHAVPSSGGAKTDAISAEWVLADLRVTFEGMAGSQATGKVLIDLPEATELRDSWAAAESAQ